jgi:hypothetical protein
LPIIQVFNRGLLGLKVYKGKEAEIRETSLP